MESANAASRTKGSYLSAHHQRLRGRRGHSKADVATGHSILVAAYYILDRGVRYHDLGDDHFHRRQAQHAERYTKRLVRQLERLGHKATLEPITDAA